MKLPCRGAVVLMIAASFSSSAAAQSVQDSEEPKAAAIASPYSPYADLNYPTQVFFGDTHVHTGLSGDAGGSGTKLMPRDAYRFARGDQVLSNTGQPVKLSRPLDFSMITDHSDAMGAITDIFSGAPNIMADEQGRYFHKAFKGTPKEAYAASRELIALFANGKISPALNYQPGNPAYEIVWKDIIQAAEDYNDPGVFTTFIAYEWTSLESGNNLHRNVIFRDGPARAGQIVPYTTTPPIGSRNPRDLWKWMQNYENLTGGDVTAIAHNGNLSNGMMFALKDYFADGAEYDTEYVELRNKFERLYEVTQVKGDGEAHPFLSPRDEFAAYLTWDWTNLDLSVKKTAEMLPGEYPRSALANGFALEAKLGTNPFKFGLIGATDTHTALSTTDEDNYFGKTANYEPGPERAFVVSAKNSDLGVSFDAWQYATGGLTAIWAPENSRGALFDAMERREVYATTGTRIRLRMFGGWEFTKADALNRNVATLGYSKGVPMGSDLTPAPDGAKAPTFLLFAMRDPMGANLDRVQIIKGWLDKNGNPQDKVYDIAWSDKRELDKNGKLPIVGSTVDLSIPNYLNTIGAAELRGVWTDPEFDPSVQVFYYARVLEIPTPRWPAYDAVKFGLKEQDEAKLVSQNRAYSSPIWYTKK